MVEISEIETGEDLKAWLDSLPRETSKQEERARQVTVNLAFRAAARVFPLSVRKFSLAEPQHQAGGDDSRSDLKLLVNFWALVAASVGPSLEGVVLARAASAVRSVAKNEAAYATDAAIHAGRTVSAAANAAAHAFHADKSSWDALKEDMNVLLQGGDLGLMPLWPESADRTDFWTDMKTMLAESPNDWTAVLGWYDHLLHPRDTVLNQDMLTEIARIKVQTWNGGPEAALPVVREIWERHRLLDLIRKNPLALRILRQPISGKLLAEPIEDRDMSSISADVRQALTEFLRRCRSGSGNLGLTMVATCEATVAELRRSLNRAASNPRELLRLIEETRGGLQKIAENEGFQTDVRLDRLLGNLQRREEDICVAAPEVLEEVKARMRVRAQLLSLEQIRGATRLGAGMMMDSDGGLRAAMARAIIVINTEESSVEDRQAAWTFLSGALPRGVRAMRADGAEGHDPADAPDLADHLSRAADTVVKADKAVDVIQEAVAEGGPFATRIWTEISSGNLGGILG